MKFQTRLPAVHACRMKRTGLCDRTAKSGQLMCPRCWFLVPQALRNRINELWAASGRNIMRLGPEYTDTVREATLAVQVQLDKDLIRPDVPMTASLLVTALSLAGTAVPDREAVAGWSDPAKAIAYDWAIREHLSASDNDDVERRRRPAFLGPR
jgi:hypothetical protein